MAKSGSLHTNTYDNSYFYVNWQTANSEEDRIANNRDIINWQAGIVSGAYWYSNAVRIHYIDINGTRVFDGGVWSNIYHETKQLASGSNIIIPHNPDGTKSFNITISAWLYSDGNLSGSQTFTLDTINRYAVTNNVVGNNIEGMFKVNYTKYVSSYKYKLRISIPNVEVLERIDYDTSGAEFNLSFTTINELLGYYSTTNNVPLGFAIETYDNSGTTKLNDGKEIIITCKILDANPIFNDFEFEDINPITLALTGDSNVNINGYSTIRATISQLNHAQAQKRATMSKYRLIIDTQSLDIDYGYNEYEDVYGDIENSTSGIYNVYAIDSRNNSTLVTKLASQIIAYDPISFNSSACKVSRNNGGVGANAILTLSGNIWNDNFGSVRNSIKSLSYQYRKTTDTQWITGPTIINPTITNNTFNFEGQIGSIEEDYTFELQSSYEFKITISDELSSKTLESIIMSSAIPNISLSDDGVGIMCDYDESKGGVLQINGEVYGEVKTYKETLYDTGTSGASLELGWKRVGNVVQLNIVAKSSSNVMINQTRFEYTIPEWAKVSNSYDNVSYSSDSSKLIGSVRSVITDGSGTNRSLNINMFLNTNNVQTIFGTIFNSTGSSATLYATINYIVD